MANKTTNRGDAPRTEERVHIAIRIGNLLNTESGPIDVVTAHNEMFESCPIVAFGKFGKPLSQKMIEILSSQIAEEKQTFLYVVRKTERGFESYRAPLAGVSSASPRARKPLPYVVRKTKLGFESSRVTPSDRDVALPRAEKPAPSPAYDDEFVSTWLCLKSKFVAARTDVLFLRSNRRPLIDVVSETRTPVMLVNEKLS